jgi:serine/threonine protein kinase
MDFNVTMRYLLAKARRESDRGPIFVERLYVGLLTLAEANTRDIARTPSQLEAVKRDIEDVKRFLAKSKIDIWPSCFLIEEALAGRLPFSEVPVADPDSSRFLERARKKAENDRSLSIAPLDVLEANGLAPTPLLRLCVTEISDGPTSKDKADERGLAAFREKLGVSPESSNLSAFSGLTDILSVPLTVEPGESLDRPGVTENKDGAPAASPGGSPLTSVGLAPSSMVRPLELGALILDTYRIVGGPIAGGMGQVWRVRHTGWDVDLALKQPHAKLFKNAAQKANFINECYAWLDLGLHPHIVSCYYIREIGGVPSIFSEWMDGGSLNDWIYSASRSEAPKLYRGGEEAALERSLDVAIQ